RSGRLAPYCGTVAAVFVALFSKQSAIVLPAVLVLYDALIDRRRLWPVSWPAWRGYVPFVALTIFYLALRVVAFSDPLRSSALTLSAVLWFIVYQGMYAVMLLSGRTVIVRDDFALPIVTAVVVLTVILWLLSAYLRTGGSAWRERTDALVYFGPVWW